MESKDIILNSDNTATYQLREEGEVTGTYSGTVLFKCFLTPLETLQAGRLYRELLGGNPEFATQDERFIAWSLSQLQVRIKKAPPFWTSADQMAGNLPDLNILAVLLEKSISAEALYKENLKKRKDEALKKATQSTEQLQKEMTEKPNESK